MVERESLSPKQQAYLRLVEEGAPSLSYAAKRAGISTGQVYAWRRDVEGFREHEDICWEHSKDVVRDEIRRRALYGTQRPVLVNGRPLPMRDPTTGEVLLDEDFEPIYVTYVELSDRVLELDAKVSGLLKDPAAPSTKVTLTETKPDQEGERKVTIEIIRSDGNGGMPAGEG